MKTPTHKGSVPPLSALQSPLSFPRQNFLSNQFQDLKFFFIIFWLEVSSKILQAAKVYRDLQKAVKKHIGKEDYKRHFGDYITQEFRKNCNVSDQSSIQQKLKLARDYTFLLNSVHQHKELLFSYNIAVDRSDEMRKILGKSAASVGLQLPEAYQP